LIPAQGYTWDFEGQKIFYASDTDTDTMQSWKDMIWNLAKSISRAMEGNKHNSIQKEGYFLKFCTPKIPEKYPWAKPWYIRIFSFRVISRPGPD